MEMIWPNGKVFFNSNFNVNNKLIKTNLLVPIDFSNLSKSLISIEKSIKKSKGISMLKYKKINFNSFFN